VANFFCKGPHGEWLRLCEICSLCCLVFLVEEAKIILGLGPYQWKSLSSLASGLELASQNGVQNGFCVSKQFLGEHGSYFEHGVSTTTAQGTLAGGRDS
jgi:hypothetical protein